MARLLMTAPIVLDNRGDISVHASIEDALAYAEPIDVENGEYEAFDAGGRLIVLGTAPGGRLGNRRTVVVSAEDTPSHAEDLRARAVGFLRRSGAQPVPPEQDLSAVVARLLHSRRHPGAG